MCGELKVNFDIYPAYLVESTCACRNNHTIKCSTSALGCSDEMLAEICTTYWRCGCEEDAGCFGGLPENRVPYVNFGCSLGAGAWILRNNSHRLSEVLEHVENEEEGEEQ